MRSNLNNPYRVISFESNLWQLTDKDNELLIIHKDLIKANILQVGLDFNIEKRGRFYFPSIVYTDNNMPFLSNVTPQE